MTLRYLSGVVTLKYDAEKCVGCKRCVEVCPHAVFVMEGKKAAVVDRDLCMECGACENNCEFGAIRVNSGVGCASAVISSMIKGGEATCDCGGPDPGACCQ